MASNQPLLPINSLMMNPSSVPIGIPAPNAGAPAPYAPADEIEEHILRPNATTMQQIVDRINGGKRGAADGVSNAMCCAVGCCGLLAFLGGRLFRTGVGRIDIWLDSSKRPLALEPNDWQWRPNFFQERLGNYDMADDGAFQSAGVCINKIESGSVYFAHSGGQPVMIAADNNQRAGWFVTVDAGFSFAREIIVDGMKVFDCRAKLSSSYINFESLHLFNVQPNTVHVVSKFIPGVGNQWQVLSPGSHSFSSPFMRSTAVIPTSIQDCIITEDRVSTQDGVVLSNCKAVLSFQIKMEDVSKLLNLEVSNYRRIIEDWAKRTMLHEIGNIDYQSHNSQVRGEADSTSVAQPQATLLGTKGGNRMSGTGDGQDGGFRPALEHHMRFNLETSLRPYGVSIINFALQSYDPPAALAQQVTAALARRTEALYQFQAAQIQNQTLISAAEAEATAIRTRAAAVAKAAEATASVPHARQLQILDKQVEIAKAWSCGNAKTLVLQGGAQGGGLPFASINELAAEGEASSSSGNRR